MKIPFWPSIDLDYVQGVVIAKVYTIGEAIMRRAGPDALNFLEGEQFIELAAESTYELLPLPIRYTFKREQYKNYLSKNRDTIAEFIKPHLVIVLGRLAEGAVVLPAGDPPAAQLLAGPAEGVAGPHDPPAGTASHTPPV